MLKWVLCCVFISWIGVFVGGVMFGGLLVVIWVLVVGMMCGVLVVDFVWGEYGVVVCIVVLFVYVLWFVWYGCDFDVMYYGVCLCVMVV